MKAAQVMKRGFLFLNGENERIKSDCFKDSLVVILVKYIFICGIKWIKQTSLAPHKSREQTSSSAK